MAKLSNNCQEHSDDSYTLAKELCRGSITILLVIVLVPVMAVAGLFVDAARYQLARSRMASAGDITLNTALANYDTVLKDVYGLFAVYSSDEQDLEDHLKEYFTDMLVEGGVAKSDGEVDQDPYLSNTVNATSGAAADLLALGFSSDDETFEAKGVDGSDLSDSDILMHQIVEFEKYRAPANAALSILDGIQAIKKMYDQMKLAQASAEVGEALGDLNKKCKELYDECLKYKKIESDAIAAMSELDSIEGKSYKDIYADEIIPSAITLYVVYDADEQGASTTADNKCGYKVYIFAKDTPMLSNGDKPNNILNRADSTELKQQVTYLTDFLSSDSSYSKYYDRICNETDTSTETIYYYCQIYTDYMTAAYQLQIILEKLANTVDNWEDYKNNDGKELYEKACDELDKAVTATKKGRAYFNKITSQASYATNRAAEIVDDCASKIATLTDAKTSIDLCKEKLKKIKDLVDAVSTANENFGKDIAAYGEQDTFSSQMSAEHDAYSETIDMEEYNKFVLYIDSLQYELDCALKYMENIKFLDQPVNSTNLNDLSKIVGLFSSVSVNGTTISRLIVDKKSDDTYILNSIMSTYTSGGVERPEWENIGKIGDQGFYQYLEKTFAGSDESKNSKEKKAQDEMNKAAKNGIPKDFSPSGLSNNSMTKYENKGDDSKTGIDKNNISTKGYSSMIDNITSLVKSIADAAEKGTLLTGLRDKLYAIDYVFNMFSWYTQEAECSKKGIEPITTTGIHLNETNNYLYRAEIEYATFGKATAGENVGAAKAFIFAIRFICNSIHALTDNEIDAYTLPPAMAIQAATCGVVPYQVPQIIFKLALALLESSFDLNKLLAGEEVPFLKDKSTFTFNAQGAINEAKKETVVVANMAIDKTAEWGREAINSLIDLGTDKVNDTVDDLSGKLTDAVNAQVSQAVSGVFNSFSKSLIGNLSRVTARLSEDANAVADDIIDQADQAARNCLAQQGGNIASGLSDKYNSFIANNKDIFKQMIAEKIGQLDGAAKPSTIIQELEDSITKTINNAADSAIKSLSKSLKDGVESLADGVKDKVQSATDEAVETAKQDATASINDWFDENFGSDTASTASGAGSSDEAASGGLLSCLKFSYTDYLKMILFVKVTANQDAVLTRIGNLITANIHHSSENDGEIQHSAGKSFDLSNCYSYYSLNASTSLDTMFLAMPMIVNNMNKEEFTEFTVTYYGARGY